MFTPDDDVIVHERPVIRVDPVVKFEIISINWFKWRRWRPTVRIMTQVMDGEPVERDYGVADTWNGSVYLELSRGRR